MSSQQMLAQVTTATGATRTDVIRVATSGGSTRTDWAIAHAIEAAGGRPAYELMLLAGREEEIAAIWADSRADAAPVAPTNPRAEYDPEVVVYPEHTSPEETREVIAHHPGDHDTDLVEDQDDELAAAEHLAATVHADLAHLLDDAAAATRITTWSTPTEGREQLARVLELHPNRRVREALAARTGNAPLAA